MIFQIFCPNFEKSSILSKLYHGCQCCISVVNNATPVLNWLLSTLLRHCHNTEPSMNRWIFTVVLHIFRLIWWIFRLSDWFWEVAILDSISWPRTNHWIWYVTFLSSLIKKNDTRAGPSLALVGPAQSRQSFLRTTLLLFRNKRFRLDEMP